MIKINRWSLALVLLLALALLLLPASGYLPVSTGPGDARVKQGVTMLKRDFSGKTENEVRAMLKEMGFESAPVAAREERVSGISYVIPEVNGYSLDPDQTWFRLAIAAEGSRVEPATRVHTPNKRISDFPESVIRQGNANKQAVALLINVDWGEKELAQMLPVLKKRGVKVTFFVSGRWANTTKHLLKAMAEDGHEIASHGYDLKYGPNDLAKAGKLKDDIARSVAAIEEITGAKVTFYAPHMSEIEPPVVKAAADLKLRPVLYSLDTVDWRDTTSGDAILATIGKALPGDLILLHPKPNTAKVLEKALLQLESKGLHPVTLSDLLSPNPEAPSSAYSNQHE